MNERLEALDDEAQEYAGRIAGNDEDSNYVEWFNIYKAKFAELIVRECADICQDIDGEDNIDARSGRQDCAVEIKEHFGVEE